MILLGKKYRSRSILRDGYSTVVRDQSISTRDLQSPYGLDWQTIAEIFAAKAHVLKEQLELPQSAGFDNCIDTMFKEELDGMDDE